MFRRNTIFSLATIGALLGGCTVDPGADDNNAAAGLSDQQTSMYQDRLSRWAQGCGAQALLGSVPIYAVPPGTNIRRAPGGAADSSTNADCEFAKEYFVTEGIARSVDGTIAAAFWSRTRNVLETPVAQANLTEDKVPQAAAILMVNKQAFAQTPQNIKGFDGWKAGDSLIFNADGTVINSVFSAGQPLGWKIKSRVGASALLGNPLAESIQAQTGWTTEAAKQEGVVGDLSTFRSLVLGDYDSLVASGAVVPASVAGFEYSTGLVVYSLYLDTAACTNMQTAEQAAP